MAILGTSEIAWGEVWIPPVQRPVTQSEFVDMVWTQIGRLPPAKIQLSGRTTTRLLGMFVPALREMVEMLYGFENTFVVDSSKFEHAFGVSATPLEDAIATTVKWYQK